MRVWDFEYSKRNVLTRMIHLLFSKLSSTLCTWHHVHNSSSLIFPPSKSPSLWQPSSPYYIAGLAKDLMVIYRPSRLANPCLLKQEKKKPQQKNPPAISLRIRQTSIALWTIGKRVRGGTGESQPYLICPGLISGWFKHKTRVSASPFGVNTRI